MVEVDDPGVSFTVTGDGVSVRGAGPTELRVRPGAYTVAASRDGVPVGERSVTVPPNGREVLAFRRPAPPAVPPAPAPAAVPPLPADPNRQALVWLRSLPVPSGQGITDGTGGIIMVEPSDPIPTTPFALEWLVLKGPVIDGLGTGLADALAVHLRGCRPRAVVFAGRALTTAAAVQVLDLPEFSGVTLLSFEGTLVDDGLFADLGRRRRLTEAQFHVNPRLTGTEISALAGCERLENLLFARHPAVPVDPDFITNISLLTRLRRLNLDGVAPTTRRDWVKLAGMGLTQVVLPRNSFDDEAAAVWSSVPDSHLESLSITFCPLTDAGLAHLQRLKSLKRLDLSGTKVTKAGVEAFRRAKPGCEVVWKD